MEKNSLKPVIPWGTFINMLTVTVGSLVGLGVQSALPPAMETIVFQAIGLGVLLIGIKMALEIPSGYLLVFIFSLILGGIIGVLLRIDLTLQNLGDQLQTTFALGSNDQFTQGLITAFLLFCVGAMTVIGALEEGLSKKRDLLLVKSTLDGVSSIAFAATYGIGVLFSIIPMLILQGGITLTAGWIQAFFTKNVLAQLSAVGGVLIIGIAIRLLQLADDIQLENLLPALPVVVLLTWSFDRIQKLPHP